MKYFLLIPFIIVSLAGVAQKKLVPVSQSTLTGISLPANSKQDGRFLMVAAAKLTLQMESKKNGVTVSNTEVLSLAPLPVNGFNIDSLNFQLSNLGWSVTPVQTDNKYLWLQKNGRMLMAYFSNDKKETTVFFGETAALTQGTQGNNGDQNTGYNTQQPVLQNTGGDQNNTQNSGSNTDPQQGMQNTGADQNNNIQNSGSNNNQQNTFTPPVPVASGSNGIIISTINFDDGWTAVPKEDWVMVSKNDITCFIHYAIPLPDDLRSGDGDPILNFFWSKLIEPRYNINNIQKKSFDPFAYKRTYFIEADGTDKSNGQSLHIGFRIFINNGIATCVEVAATNKTSYDATFSDIEKFNSMLGYNRFAISTGDITGLWKESSGGFAQYYNVYSGNYAGMNAVSINSQLTLDPQGNFLLEHKGAGGMVGSQQFFSEKYNGTYSLSNWELVTTEQNGKVSQYNAYYQAIKNGRILYLQNKQYTAQEYFMIKAE